MDFTLNHSTHLFPRKILASGYGVDSDHDSIGAAVATITCNVLELVEIIQMINTILEGNRETIHALIGNIKKLNEVLVDLFDAVNPKDPIDGFLNVASNIGSRSKLVIDPILSEFGMKTQGEDKLSSKAKLVSQTVDIFAQKAKDLANSCNNDEGKEMVLFTNLKMFLFISCHFKRLFYYFINKHFFFNCR